LKKIQVGGLIEFNLEVSVRRGVGVMPPTSQVQEIAVHERTPLLSPGEIVPHGALNPTIIKQTGHIFKPGKQSALWPMIHKSRTILLRNYDQLLLGWSCPLGNSGGSYALECHGSIYTQLSSHRVTFAITAVCWRRLLVHNGVPASRLGQCCI